MLMWNRRSVQAAGTHAAASVGCVVSARPSSVPSANASRQPVTYAEFSYKGHILHFNLAQLLSYCFEVTMYNAVRTGCYNHNGVADSSYLALTIPQGHPTAGAGGSGNSARKHEQHHKSLNHSESKQHGHSHVRDAFTTEFGQRVHYLAGYSSDTEICGSNCMQDRRRGVYASGLMSLQDTVSRRMQIETATHLMRDGCGFERVKPT